MIAIDFVQLTVLVVYLIDFLLNLYAFKKNYLIGLIVVDIIWGILILIGTIIETKQTIDKEIEMEDTFRYREFIYRLLKFILIARKIANSQKQIESKSLAAKYEKEIMND
jgi:large-conductance mechanosensitive channel